MAKIRCVDMHIHPMTREYYQAVSVRRNHAMEDYFGHRREGMIKKDIQQIVTEHDAEERLDIQKMVLLGWNTSHVCEGLKFPNEQLAQMIAAYPEKLIGFCQVNPQEGIYNCVKEIEHCVKDLKLSGLKLHPPLQDFFANDRNVYPIYEACAALDIPVMFHTGYTGVGTGVAGGDGIKQKYGNPLYVDEVAADFPKLRIVMAHPSWPYEDIAIGITLHKPNVFMELSSFRPKFYPDSIKKYLRTKFFIRKAMFGTDAPYLNLREFVDDLEGLKLSPEYLDRFMYGTAEEFLRL